MQCVEYTCSSISEQNILDSSQPRYLNARAWMVMLPWQSTPNFSTCLSTVPRHSFCKNQTALLENLTDDAIAQFYVTKFSTISLYLTKLYVTFFFFISISFRAFSFRYFPSYFLSLYTPSIFLLFPAPFPFPALFSSLSSFLIVFSFSYIL